MLKTGYLDLQDIKKNSGLISQYDATLNAEYGTDGITTVLHQGKVYYANATKGNMGTDVPDANANWIDTMASQTATVQTRVYGVVVLTTNADIAPGDPIKFKFTKADKKAVLLNDTTAVSAEVSPDVVIQDNDFTLAHIVEGLNIQCRLNNVTIGAETITDASSDANNVIVALHLDTVTTATIPSGTKIAINYIGYYK